MYNGKESPKLATRSADDPHSRKHGASRCCCSSKPLVQTTPQHDPRSPLSACCTRAQVAVFPPTTLLLLMMYFFVSSGHDRLAFSTGATGKGGDDAAVLEENKVGVRVRPTGRALGGYFLKRSRFHTTLNTLLPGADVGSVAQLLWKNARNYRACTCAIRLHDYIALNVYPPPQLVPNLFPTPRR